MAKKDCGYADHFQAATRALVSRGLLLGSYDARGKANLMTIGWGLVGSVWGKPLWTVLVRPSRYTYECIEASGCFTVNVPAADLAEACGLCGTRSGRDTDKWAACRLTAERGRKVNAPVVAECPVVYECRVVHSNDILPPRLADEILAKAYPGGDFHRVYWGEILAAYADPDADRRLGGA